MGSYRSLHGVRHCTLYKYAHAVLLLLIAAVKGRPFLRALNAALTAAAARAAKQHSPPAALELSCRALHARPETRGREPPAHARCCAGGKQRLHGHREQDVCEGEQDGAEGERDECGEDCGGDACDRGGGALEAVRRRRDDFGVRAERAFDQVQSAAVERVGRGFVFEVLEYVAW